MREENKVQLGNDIDDLLEKTSTHNDNLSESKKSKKIVFGDNHINLSKTIIKKDDEKYLSLKRERIDEYKAHLKNGGTISLSIDKYLNTKNKREGKLKSQYTIAINDLIELGFRDKKHSIYRVKIIGEKILEN